jgi:Thioredoxin-like
MYPHERSLVKRLADKPFAIIGVNSDEDRDAIKKVLEKENITWRSFWNDGGTDGPISTAWNVRGWPTIYLLDHEGVIHYKGHGEDEAKFDARIDKLVEAAEKARAR